MDIDEWLGDKCCESHTLATMSFGAHYIVNGVRHEGVWNYKNPLCREIIRERFLIMTLRNTPNDVWESIARATPHAGKGKTIPEAECKCIEAIYATEDR